MPICPPYGVVSGIGGFFLVPPLVLPATAGILTAMASIGLLVDEQAFYDKIQSLP